MKFSIGITSIMLTSALALAVDKRQNDTPKCKNGDQTNGQGGGPYGSIGECEPECYLTEQDGDRVGQICKGYCEGTPLITGMVSYNCYGKDS